jgi:signal peptidase I
MSHDPRLAPSPAETVRKPALRALLDSSVDVAKTLVFALLLALMLRTFVAQPYTIPSSSMEPTLVTGDYILVSKFAYGWSRASLPFNPPLPHGRFGGPGPRRGDVVVFRLPRDPRQTWVKRVIGLPGDQVQVVRGEVRVNGASLAASELRATWDHDAPWRPVLEARETDPDGRSHAIYRGDPRLWVENTGVYRVPRGSYFVMGDNRDNSLDSRFGGDTGVGFLPAETIVGKAVLVAFSWRPPASPVRPWSWLGFLPNRFARPIP